MMRWNLMRKGQAAMEFLMTYGWAILVVLAAIGALAYFGVLSPDKFLPDKCTANPPFSCGEYKISELNGLNISLQNNAGVDAYINSVNVSCAATNSGVLATLSIPPATVTPNGNSNYFSLTPAELATAGCTGVTQGSKFKATYIILYTKTGETQSHTGSGSVQVKVEA